MKEQYKGKLKGFDSQDIHGLVWGEGIWEGYTGLIEDPVLSAMSLEYIVDFSLKPMIDFNSILMITSDNTKPLVLYLNLTESLMEAKQIQKIIRLFKYALYGRARNCTGTMGVDLKLKKDKKEQYLLKGRNGTLAAFNTFSAGSVEISANIESKFSRRNVSVLRYLLASEFQAIKRRIKK